MAKKSGSGGINPMMKMMLKQFVPMIKEKLSGADGFVQELQQSDPLEPGEDEIVFMLTTDEGVAWIATVALSVGAVVRVIRKEKLTDFVSNLLNNI